MEEMEWNVSFLVWLEWEGRSKDKLAFVLPIQEETFFLFRFVLYLVFVFHDNIKIFVIMCRLSNSCLLIESSTCLNLLIHLGIFDRLEICQS